MTTQGQYGDPEQIAALEQRWQTWERWRTNDGVDTSLELVGCVLDEEPPCARISRRGLGEESDFWFVLNRGDGPAVYIVDADNVRVPDRQVAREMVVHPEELASAKRAILDGLEQSERSAGRTPADRAPDPVRPVIGTTQARHMLDGAVAGYVPGTDPSWGARVRAAVEQIESDFTIVSDGEVPGSPGAQLQMQVDRSLTIRDRNQQRMAGQAPAGIRDEDPASPLSRPGPRPGR